MTDVGELQARLHEIIDGTLVAVPVDRMEVEVDHVRAAECFGPSDGALGEYAFLGPLPEGADPVAVVTAAADHWDEVGIRHDGVRQDDYGVYVYASIEEPGTNDSFDIGVAFSARSRLVSVSGTTPCVPGAVAE